MAAHGFEALRSRSESGVRGRRVTHLGGSLDLSMNDSRKLRFAA